MLASVTGSILVVDNDPIIRDFLYEALDVKGYTVMLAHNGYEALEVLKQNQIAMIITDMRMPRMNGLVLLKKIKELFPNVPVVVITGHETVNGAVETMKFGASDYLPNPITMTRIS